MPFINIHIGKPISEEKKVEVMKMIAENMPLLPEKNKDNTMIEISAGRDMYMSLEKQPLIFADIRVFTPAPFENKDRFVRTLSENFHTLLDIPVNKQYYTIGEYPSWGYGGSFHEM